MTLQLIPRQLRRAHPHPRAQPPDPLTASTPAMPARAGIQHLGLCGVRP